MIPNKEQHLDISLLGLLIYVDVLFPLFLCSTDYCSIHFTIEMMKV